MKKNKGITLIALVITTIVLLILAGVTISTLTGENGLLSKSKLAKEKSINATINENSVLDQYANLLDSNGQYISTDRGSIETHQYAGFRYADVRNMNGLYYFSNYMSWDSNLRTNSNGTIILNANITYNIDYSVRFYPGGDGRIVEIGLYDIENNKFIVSDKDIVLVNQWNHYKGTLTYTPNKDIIVKVAMMSNANIQEVPDFSISINSYKKEVGNIKYNIGEQISGVLVPGISSSTGELQTDTSNKTIKLLAGKTYKIDCKVRINSSDVYGNMQVINKTTGEQISHNSWWVTDGSFNNYIVYTPQQDCEIYLYLDRQGGGTSATVADGTEITIYEVY